MKQNPRMGTVAALLVFLSAALAGCPGGDDPEVATDEHDAPASEVGSDGADSVGGEAECQTNSDCAGRVSLTGPCQFPVCLAGRGECAAGEVTDGTACDDGSACTADDACLAGICLAGLKVGCDDGEACTVDDCDPETGCTTTPKVAACDDGSACTSGDTCTEGTCQGTAVGCDDGNPCTSDGCHPATGCVYSDNSAPCDDADACTLDDTCAGGSCAGGPAKPCDDANVCTTDVCDAASGCLHLANDAACDDGSSCTTGEICDLFVCAGGVSTCLCDVDSDCAAFDDTDLCNGVLFCDPATKTCLVDPPTVVVCTASETSCSANVCDPGSGQCAETAAAEGTPCDDGDLCTVGDTCQAGSCTAGPPASCDDGNPCTADSCGGAGCEYTAQGGGDCDDGDGCTVGDGCVGQVCVGGPAMACDDGNGCTSDSCVDGACVATPNTEPCDDGDPCTSGTVCGGGSCGGGGPTVCDDGNPCTDGTCHADYGCVYTANGSCEGCSGVSCLACAYGAECAATGEPIPGTCCAAGDSLQHLATGMAAEAVDIEVDDKYAYLCGGFGVRVNKISNPADPQFIASKLSRCQRIHIGPTLESGNRVVWFAHHGDTWVNTPFLSTWNMTPFDELIHIDTISSGDTLFEGMAHLEKGPGYLYSAVHGGGLKVYELAAGGKPSEVFQLGGFANAWKLDIAGEVAYVADGEGGLKVVDLSTPSAPVLVASIPTAGVARDVDAHAGRVFVALGGNGVVVFDATNPLAPVEEATIDTMGSAQAVSANGGLLSVAAWNHLGLYDIATLQLLGTEDVTYYPHFEQIFGVSLRDNIAYVAEWEGLHMVQYVPGHVAPDIWITEELLDFGTSKTARAVLVRNRGTLDLQVTKISVTKPEIFSVNTETLTVPPGGVDVFEVHYDPSVTSAQVNATLVIETNDPDPGQSPFKMHLLANGSTSYLDVGDPLSSKFGFLDPSGAGQVSGLEGKVVVLAYFALF